MFNLKYRLCGSAMRVLVIKMSKVIKMETMSFESRVSMFQKKARDMDEMMKYEATADLSVTRGMSPAQRASLMISSQGSR